ncbi:MAG: hypothetical protein MUC29_09045, partial [Pyrinomonadaceae bacterium]|nr:hypothetical protein [Pyrinomonadaceae bacterium]
MKKIITFVILLLTFSLCVFAQDDTQRVSAAWQVNKYDLNVTPSERLLNAKAVLNLQNVGNGAGSRLTLRISPNAEVSAVQVNGNTANFTKGEEKLSGSSTLQRIIISIPSVQPKGTTQISVDYKLKVDENNGLNAISPIGSQFLPMSFWYPTPNSQFAPKGADFAPFNIKVNSTDTVISSGIANGTNFEQRLNGQPFFLTGNWDIIDVKGVTVYLPKGFGDFERQRANELANLLVEANTFTASLLGSGTNIPLRIVATRRGSGFADAGTVLLDYGAFRRQKIDAQTAMTIAESSAKVWLGNEKLVKGEGYGVIREGLSRFIATQFIEKQFGKESADVERLRQRNSYATIARSDAPFNQTSPLDASYFPSVANKGAMIWRVLANSIGQNTLFGYLKTQEIFTLLGTRTTFSNIYPVLDFPISNATDTNLLVGLPQVNGAETKVALRNTGSIAVNVNVVALTDKGEKLIEKTSINPTSFGEVTFKTTSKIIRTEIDPEKFYPQLDYSDDVAPREFTESNPIIAIKRSFDKQDFIQSEKYARLILQNTPQFDEARTWLGRILLAQNKLMEAEKELKSALDVKLPSSNTFAWANVGLGEVTLKTNKSSESTRYFEESLKADADYGATYAARTNRQKTGSTTIDESIKTFFAQFDKAALTARKTEVESLVLGG